MKKLKSAIKALYRQKNLVPMHFPMAMRKLVILFFSLVYAAAKSSSGLGYLHTTIQENYRANPEGKYLFSCNMFWG
jgi:hypothetical protein